MHILVTLDVACSEPESFSSQAEFDKNDGRSMRPYIKEKIQDAVRGAYNYTAKVDGFKVTVLQ